MALAHVHRSTFVPILVILMASTLFTGLTSKGRSEGDAGSLSDQQVSNLVAFTRVYGYVRFFHPSDEASNIDWDKFAIYGCSRMLTCANHHQLMAALIDLFLPIAPSVKIFETARGSTSDMVHGIPADSSHLKPVAWQHLGIGLAPNRGYRSIRLNRRDTTTGENRPRFGTITTQLDPSHLHGRRITLRAGVRVEEGSRGQLWLRVDRPQGKIGFFDNMNDRPITSTEWGQYEISGIVDSDAVGIYFGCMVKLTGKLWLDDMHVFSGEEGRMKEENLPNGDFESDSVGTQPRGWGRSSMGYVAVVTDKTASKGTKSVMLKSAPLEQPSELFPEKPTLGEVISADLPGGISCSVPLVLLSDSTGTIPHPDANGLHRLMSHMNESMPGRITGNDRAVRLADVAMAWNVMEHFYPYFDLVKVDWEGELRRTMDQASRDTSEHQFLRTLRRFVAQLQDGHAAVSLDSDSSGEFLPPLQWIWAEDRLVVTAVSDSTNTSLAVGDIVLAVNSVEARQAVEAEERNLSGATPQRKRYRALASLLSGPKKSALELTTESITGERRTFSLHRTLSWQEYAALPGERTRPTAEIADGVYYINLSVSPMSAIDSLMPELAGARGIICDLRGYPNGNHDLICHLLTGPDTAAHWMAIPKVIYPDRERPAGFQYFGWHLQPKQPHINGKVVFLTNGRAISYAESYMSLIEHYRLAEIVGEPTAGTSGNVNILKLPGGYSIPWTGMKVTKLDGSQFHGVGVKPTVIVHRTVDGIREGRDEQFEAALALINNSRR